MTPDDLHPEPLLDRLRSGTITIDEWAALTAHVERCAACRLQLLAQQDFSRELEPVDLDALHDRLVDGAMRRLDAAPAVATMGRFRRNSLRVMLAAAAVIVSLSAAAAVWRTATRGPGAPPAGETAPASHGAAIPSTTLAPGVDLGEVEPAPSASAAIEATVPSAHAAAASSPAAPAPTAAELFSSANQARRAHRDDEAIRLYRELQRRYPASREADASRAMLGQLLLDGNDTASALAEFDSYGSSGSRGAVSEEVLVGRAMALMKMGRNSEERGAWETLLAQYPASAHASFARERLRSLR